MTDDALSWLRQLLGGDPATAPRAPVKKPSDWNPDTAPEFLWAYKNGPFEQLSNRDQVGPPTYTNIDTDPAYAAVFRGNEPPKFTQIPPSQWSNPTWNKDSGWQSGASNPIISDAPATSWETQPEALGGGWIADRSRPPDDAGDALARIRQLLGGGQGTPQQPGGGIGALFDAISGSPAIQAMRAPNAGAIDLSAATGLPPATESMLAGRAYDPSRSFAANALDPRGIEQAMNVAMSVGPGAIRAYHGSPYDFSQFDLSKIGTGEGAQRYGHGLYFAENPEVAAGYRKRLAGNPIGPTWDLLPEYFKPGNIVPGYGGTMDKVLEFRPGDDFRFNVKVQEVGRESGNPIGSPRWHSTLPDPREIEQVLGKKLGTTYEAQINAEPEHFLDWDKPLSEQSPQVRDIIAGRTDWTTPDMPGARVYQGIAERLAQARPETPPGWTSVPGGPVAYDAQVHDPAAASRVLREAGIPGIRYLDQGSRVAGAGTYNYSVFDDKLIEILRKYGILPPLAAGAAGAGLLGSGSEPPT